MNPQDASNSPYVSLRVFDGDRVLKPTHVGPTIIIFPSAPHLIHSRIVVESTYNGLTLQAVVEVLEHAADATHVPIRLIDS